MGSKGRYAGLKIAQPSQCEAHASIMICHYETFHVGRMTMEPLLTVRRCLSIRIVPIFAVLLMLTCVCQPKALASGFSLTATNVTLDANSGIEVPSTVVFQSLGGYTGTVVWACGPASDPAPAYSPTCTVFPVTPLSLTANGSATRKVWLVPYGFAAPLARRAGFGSAVEWVALVLLPFAVRQSRGRGWRTVAGMLATLAIAAGVSACGGSSRPTGTFPMVVVAQDGNNPQIAARATFTATVQ